MTAQAVTTLELRSIEEILEMGGGYVLDFTDRTFGAFFGEHGVDINAHPGSKANRLRAFLRSAPPGLAADVLEGLLALRKEVPGKAASPSLTKYRNVIARLRGSGCVALTASATDALDMDYVRELEQKTDQRLKAADLEGAITVARTMLEGALVELERRLVENPEDHKGDLPRLFKSVAKRLGIVEDRGDLDDNFKQVARGLLQVVNGLAPLRNKMSDGHARERKPAVHHARFIVNAARTVVTFLVESYVFQLERGLLAPAPMVGGDGPMRTAVRGKR